VHGHVYFGDLAAKGEVSQRTADDPDAFAPVRRDPGELGEVALRGELRDPLAQVFRYSGTRKIGLPAYNLWMPSRPSTVTPEVVRRVAALARLRVPETELSLWARQLDRIVSYIDQLKELPADVLPTADSSTPTPFRPDAPHPGDGDRALGDNAPALSHGFGVVPRVVGGGE
jgi:aspartyl-tRNA(Asn)/glutamyl-tRNA(Gln) amidotransferase subunit C